MYDEDAIFELGEQIRSNANDALNLVWERTHDEDLWRALSKLLDSDIHSADHKGVEECLEALYEEVGIEFCEECGERLESCTCEEDEEEGEDEEAEEAEA